MARRIIHLLVLLLFLLLFLSLSLLGRQNERLLEYEESLFKKEQDILAIENEKSDMEKEESLLKNEFKKLNEGHEKSVILTFDDGPSPVTPGILNILKEKEVRAVFFINGINVTERTIPILKRAAKEGHIIGNHSYSHDYENIYTSADAFMADFIRNETLIREIVNRRSMFFRFPGGSRNSRSQTEEGRKIMDEIIERLDHYGYVYTDWNVTSNEKDPALLADDLFEQTRWRNRAVILLHDRFNSSELLKALPLLIDRLREEGYAFELIDPSRQVVQF